MSSINGDDPSAVVPEVTNPAFVTSPNSAAASGPRGPVPRQMTTAQTLSKLSETGGIDNMPGVVMRTLHRKAKLETVLHRQYSAIDAAEKKKEEAPATVQDRLTDYLLYNAALDVEHKWNNVYTEGFAGNDGCDRNYWLQAVEDEDEDNGDENSKMKQKVWRTPDNRTFSSLNPRVRRFFELGGYRAFPDVVTVEMSIREILGVDVQTGTFRCSFVLQVRWYDRFFDKAEFAAQAGEEVFSTTIPYITLDHGDEGADPVGFPEDAANLDDDVKHTGKATLRKGKADPPGVLYHSQRIQASFRAENHLHWFPFDKHNLNINIRLWGSSVKNSIDHGRILLPLSVKMELAHHQLEWRSFQAFVHPTQPRMARQDLQVSINVVRKFNFFFQNVFVPIFAITTLSFCAFAVPYDSGVSDDPDDDTGFVGGYDGRMQITLTLLLSSIAYKFYLNDMLAQAPYLTFIDWYIYIAFLFIALILVANTVVLWPSSTLWLGNGDGGNTGLNMDNVQQVDSIIFYALAGLWVTANVVFGLAIRHRTHKLDSHFRAKFEERLGEADKGVSDACGVDRPTPMIVYSDQDAVMEEHNGALSKWWHGPESKQDRSKLLAIQEDMAKVKRHINQNHRQFIDAHTDSLRNRRNTALQNLERKKAHFTEQFERNNRPGKLKEGQLSELEAGIRTHSRQCLCPDCRALFPLWVPGDKVATPRGGKLKAPGHCDCRCCRERRGGEHVVVDRELSKLFKRAGLEQDGAGLGMKFAFHGIDFDDLERIFSPGGVKFVGVGSESLLQLLTEIGLETSERAKVLAALAGPKEMKVPKEPTTLIALQGSASYLMIGLGIEKLLLTKDELLERVDAQLIKFTNECANKVDGKETGDHINKKKGTVLAANCLYARALLSSSTINAEYIYCQREFNDKTNLQYEVYSQVWAGFLAAKSQAAWPSGGAIAVDIGTGEMKFGYAEREIGLNPPKMWSRIGLTNMKLDAAEFFSVLDETIMALNVRLDPTLVAAVIPPPKVKLTEDQVRHHYIHAQHVRLPGGDPSGGPLGGDGEEDIAVKRLKSGLQYICSRLSETKTTKPVFDQLKAIDTFIESLNVGGEGLDKRKVVNKQKLIEAICNPIIEKGIKKGEELTSSDMKTTCQARWWDMGKIEVEMTSNELMQQLCQPMMDRLVIVTTELRMLSLIDLVKKVAVADQDSAAIEAATKAADMIVQFDHKVPLAKTDYTDACEALEKTLLPILNTALSALEDKDTNAATKLLEEAIYSGREPVFVFGTQKMRAKLREYDEEYGAQADELVKAVADFSTFIFPATCPRLPMLVGSTIELKRTKGTPVEPKRFIGMRGDRYLLEDVKTRERETVGPNDFESIAGSPCNHKIHFEMCDQGVEAACEHLAFLIALKHGKIGDPDVFHQKIMIDAIESYARGDDLNKRGTKKEHVPCGFGNLAWGNGSTQGIVSRRGHAPQDAVIVRSQMGMVAVKGILAAALKKQGASTADMKTFAFDDPSDAPARCRRAFNDATLKLRAFIKDTNPSFKLSPNAAVLKPPGNGAVPDEVRGSGGAPWEAAADGGNIAAHPEFNGFP